eukprot:3046994-Pleurochrysis_carterae.AAC.2
MCMCCACARSRCSSALSSVLTGLHNHNNATASGRECFVAPRFLFCAPNASPFDTCCLVAHREAAHHGHLVRASERRVVGVVRPLGQRQVDLAQGARAADARRFAHTDAAARQVAPGGARVAVACPRALRSAAGRHRPPKDASRDAGGAACAARPARPAAPTRGARGP